MECESDAEDLPARLLREVAAWAQAPPWLKAMLRLSTRVIRKTPVRQHDLSRRGITAI